ncbi:MAG: hypothetical protein WC756_12100 [Taibaiella sp.]|jgi:hypothetical protein
MSTKIGFWNGVRNIEFTCVTYEVTKADGEVHWQNMFVGQRRQGVFIRTPDDVWIIDNEHGDGIYKVTTGLGSPRCGHKSVVNPINVIPIPEEQWFTKYNVECMRAENDQHDEWIKENYPEQYKKLKVLQDAITRG